MDELTPKDMELLLTAVNTYLRLLGSYINKSTDDYVRISRFDHLRGKLERMITAQ